jgi:hypothetical protein
LGEGPTLALVTGGGVMGWWPGSQTALAASLAWDKLLSVSRTAPLYLPAAQPVGRSLRIVSGREAAISGDIDATDILPTRRIALGAGQSIDAPPLQGYRIEDARLVTDGRAFLGIISSGNAVISEVSEDYRSERGTYRSLRYLQRFPEARRIPAAASLLTGGGGIPTYFHWLYDVLPRLHLLERAGLLVDGGRFVVPKLVASYQRETLQLLGVKPAACIEVQGPTLLMTEQLSATAGHRSFQRVEPWIPGFLRDRLGTGAERGDLRLYINRRDTRTRRLLNEDKLERTLSSQGIRSVSLAHLGFREQVALFAAAELIVAPHGAGLSNIAFCRPGARIVELAGGAQFWPVYEDVSRAVALDHLVVPNALQTVGASWLPPHVQHLAVDVERVQQALAE